MWEPINCFRKQFAQCVQQCGECETQRFSVLVHHYLLEFFRRQLIQALQLAQALSVTLVEPEEICCAVLEQVQDQTQAGGPGVSHRWHSG